MTDEMIYGIMAEVTGREKRHLIIMWNEVPQVRPSEVVEIVRKALEMKDVLEVVKYPSNYSCYATHKPSGEDWYLLGIDLKGDRVCVAGWPPTIAKFSDCTDIEINKPLTDTELKHRNKNFGTNWD